MTTDNENTPAESLRLLRTRAGLSMDAMAKRMGLKGASSYQRYESDTYSKKLFPLSVVQKIIFAIEGEGDPPIHRSEIMSLAGVISEFDPEEKSRIPSYFVSENAKKNLPQDELKKLSIAATTSIDSVISGLAKSNKRRNLSDFGKYINRYDFMKVISTVDEIQSDVLSLISHNTYVMACIFTCDTLNTRDDITDETFEPIAQSTFLQLAGLQTIIEKHTAGTYTPDAEVAVSKLMRLSSQIGRGGIGNVEDSDDT